LKERAKIQRQFEYQQLQNKLLNSDKMKLIEWWVDHNEPDIKPYSVSFTIHDVNLLLCKIFFFVKLIFMFDGSNKF